MRCSSSPRRRREGRGGTAGGGREERGVAPGEGRRRGHRRQKREESGGTTGEGGARRQREGERAPRWREERGGATGKGGARRRTGDVLGYGREADVLASGRLSVGVGVPVVPCPGRPLGWGCWRTDGSGSPPLGWIRGREELTVGGWFAGAVIGNFVAKARSIMEEHHALQAEAEDMLYSVQAALPRITILVEVTERKAISNRSYAPWLQHFKDVASEAEDLLDDFETKRIREELLRKNCKVTSVASSALRFVRNLLLSDTDLRRLKDVLKKLNKIISDTGGPGFHGLMELADAEEGVSTRVLPQTLPVVIGRDDEKQQLLSMILGMAGEDCTEPSNKFSVTAVIGAAGVGKTTLAQVIYNNPDVKEAFALRRWVMASHRSRCKRDIVKDIVDSFVTEKQDSLQTMPAIKNKKFFLVLDDVQDSMHEIWGSLMSALAGAANGSIVLLTTQSKDAADSFGTTAHVTLNHLPFLSLYRVFEHHAFGKHKNPSLESIGKQIVQNLHGLPLLAEAIGRTKKPYDALANILSHPSGLRVLDFSYSEAKLGKTPEFFDKFPHLQLLDLSFTKITAIPDSLCKLHLLQVLGLRGCQFKELPRAMNELINLRFLFAEAHTVSLIYKLGQLTNLQGLDEFPVGKTEGHKITELKSVNELGGQLCISNLEEVTGIDIESDSELFRKRYLKKLVLKWGVPDGTTTAASEGYMKTLAGLKPNANLEELKIKCYMGVGFPAWMADEQYFTKLQHIHLIECKQLRTLPPLGQLPSLVILVLQGLSVVEKIGSEFYGTSYRIFPSLEVLTFLDMPNWREWSDIEELQDSRTLPFSHIRKVQIKNCGFEWHTIMLLTSITREAPYFWMQ
ncbi:hypothetical protein PR202_gb21014 [Eleusine coracana subsp. coracana]|uniref:Uncharacterized protein n=1 Tax=Eleusine coracana subsp. coracana TaxID=191504 RepID=A0AAV5FDN5_ELECO|nr:hypothetical protein PR202_gb21014 [Eleusine coracana subsp. coracana]